MVLHQHKLCAKIIRGINNYLLKLPITRETIKVRRCLMILKSELDNDYHYEITDKQADTLGHIYYGKK